MSARLGRLAGDIASIFQAVAEDGVAGVGEVFTAGGASAVAIPLAVHGTAVGIAGAKGTADDIYGLVNYFAKNKHKGTTFRGGNKKSRDGYLTSLPKDFQRWFHRVYKEGKGPNASKEDIDGAFREWEAQGRPTVK